MKNYVRFWEKPGNGTGVPRYYRPVIDYWSNVIEELGKPIRSEAIFFDDFWPKTQGSHQLDDMNTHQAVETFIGIEEHNEHYCGPQRERPREEFNPMLDVNQGDFLMLYPDDPNIYPVWLALAKSDIDDDPTSPNYNKLLIQYWGPCAKRQGITDAQAYANCWNKYWKINDKDPEVWEKADAIVWSWRPRGGVPGVRIRIPEQCALKEKACLGLPLEPMRDELDGALNEE